MRDLGQAVRGGVARAILTGVNDNGEAQTLDGKTHAGVTRSAVEVHYPFGFSASAPDGSYALLLAVGGDQGDMVALPPTCPAARFGGLGAGESVLYDAAGQRVHFRGGQIADVHVAASVNVTVAGTLTLQISQGLVQVTGNLVVSGQVSDGVGTMQTMRNQYNAHTNHGTGDTAPTPQMD